MSNSDYQPHLLGAGCLELKLADADVSYINDFLDVEHAWHLFDRLTSTINWLQETITVYGKEHPVPRLWCWMGDAGLNYSYSNKTMISVPWSTEVLIIKSQLEAATNYVFNSVLINCYRDGQDSNGWHADDELELGHNPVIASVSLGATRDFHLRHNYDKQLKHSIALEHGSLLIMQGTTQSYWKHQIPKRAQAETRINLTFRIIKITN